MKTYYYITADLSDGDTITWFFESEELFNLWLSMNEESDYMMTVNGDGTFRVHGGTLDPRDLETKEDIINRFKAEGDFDE